MHKPGDPVRWTSSGTTKEGVIVATVPSKTHPRDIGHGNLGHGSGWRDHESYIVRGGKPGEKTSMFWPVVSLLKAAQGLTAEEVAWCHRNAAAVRALMAR